MKRTVALVSAAVAAAVALVALVPDLSAYVAIPKRVLIRFDVDRTEPGWVIFPLQDGRAHLVNPLGETVHTWSSPVAGDSIGHVEPLDDGHVLVFGSSEPVPGCGFSCGTAYELDFAGNVVWEYADENRRLHHDLERLDNGNTLILCSEDFVDPDISPLEITDDCLIEVDPSGNVVWEWKTADHFDEFEFSQEAKDLIAESGGDWAHANTAAVVPEDIPDPSPPLVPGNIIISYRHLNFIVIVDRLTEEIVWKTDEITLGQHDTHMLTNDLEGAGNILIFDNGGEAGYPEIARLDSRVIELDPATLEIPWEYDATMSGLPLYSFFSHFVSSAQRLPNGNTLICEGMTGRIFEVTAEGDIVWELTVVSVGSLPDGSPTHHIYRAKKVRPGWVPVQLPLDGWPEAWRERLGR